MRPTLYSPEEETVGGIIFHMLHNTIYFCIILEKLKLMEKGITKRIHHVFNYICNIIAKKKKKKIQQNLQSRYVYKMHFLYKR